MKNEVIKRQSLGQSNSTKIFRKHFVKDFRSQFCAIQEVESFYFEETCLCAQNSPAWFSAKKLKMAEKFDKETK
ncbi:hypothetical protein [Flavobacterium sp.]|uniref:hypothetical protein n=1 Tax=Flavobacterium sp. TaxID=239 RepID=UPI0039E26C3C